MKNYFLIVVIASIFLLTSSSPWEGAAAVAPDGEIPAIGRFVATNSFPPHTVVDIRNMETNRSVHAIVVRGVDSPGLLAVVSREVAQIIGMRAGSISRVRVTQTSDPIAHLRFSENLSSGPVSNIENGVLEQRLLEEHYRDDTYVPPPVVAQAEPVPRAAIMERGYVVDEPEWGGAGRLSIVDVPGFLVTPVEPFVAQPVPTSEDILVVQPALEEALVADDSLIEETPVYIAEIDTLTDKTEIVNDVLPLIEETPIAEVVTEIVEEVTEVAEVVTEVAEVVTEIVEEVTEVVEEVTEVAEVVTEIVEEVIEIAEEVPPLEEPSEYVAVRPPVVPLVPRETTERLPEINGSDIPFELFEFLIPGIVVPGHEPPAPPAENRVAETRQIFSAPEIDRLHRGEYYVQLATVTFDQVENRVRQIDQRYKSVIVLLRENDNLYRLLLGPLNQGESAAMLHRFRSIGYRDAFVRRGS
jgi:hypothetical protein